MLSKLLHESAGQRTFVVIFETGEEAVAGLQAFARAQGLRGSRLTAIGAFQDATLGYFDWARKDYAEIPVREQVEVAALIGDITEGVGGEAKLHAHVVLGRPDGAALAGHLLAGRVRPTLEVTIVESPAHLRRAHDPTTGLGLIRL